MIFYYKGDKFRLSFRHHPTGKRRSTWAIITTDRALFPNDKYGPQTAISAEARCHTDDLYVKETGRKQALKALLQLGTEPGFRKAAWDCYLGRFDQPASTNLVAGGDFVVDWRKNLTTRLEVPWLFLDYFPR